MKNQHDNNHSWKWNLPIEILHQFYVLFFMKTQTRQSRYVVQLNAIVCYALLSKCIMCRQKSSKPPTSNTLLICLFSTFFFAITAISELNSNLCNRQCSFKILPQLAASFWFYVIFLNVVTSIKLRRFDFVNNDTWISAELNTFSPPLTNNCIHFNPFELIESLETLGLVTNCTWLLTDNTHKHTHIMWNVQKYFHRLQLN